MTEKEAAALRRDGRIYIMLGVGLVLVEKIVFSHSFFSGCSWDDLWRLVSSERMLSPCVILSAAMIGLGTARWIRGLRK